MTNEQYVGYPFDISALSKSLVFNRDISEMPAWISCTDVPVIGLLLRKTRLGEASSKGITRVGSDKSSMSSRCTGISSVGTMLVVRSLTDMKVKSLKKRCGVPVLMCKVGVSCEGETFLSSLWARPETRMHTRLKQTARIRG